MQNMQRKNNQKQEEKHRSRGSLEKRRFLFDQRWITALLVFVFLLTFGIRLYYAFSTDTFIGDQAYYHLRQIKHIGETFKPLVEDDLSYQGRTNLVQPLYDYVLAFFTLFFSPEFVGKLIPNLFASLLIFVVYFTTKDLTGDPEAALVSAFISGFIPIFFAETINSISPYTLAIPLFFYMVYCFYKGAEETTSPLAEKHPRLRYVYQFIFLFFLLTLLNNMTLVLLLALVVYFILLKLEKLKAEPIEKEVFLFCLFLFLWVQLIMYKKAFLMHGLGVIWQNIPEQIVDAYFRQVDLAMIIPLIGIIPLLYGLYAISHYLFQTKGKKEYLLIALIFASGGLLWARLIRLELALMIIGVALSILFSELYKSTFLYIEKTRFSRLKLMVWMGFILVLVAFTTIPSLYFTSLSMQDALSQEEVQALEWIEKNTRKNQVVLGAPREGHSIAAIAKRKNVMDTNFFFIENPGIIFDDVKDLFYTQNSIVLMKRLQKYKVDYLYLSQRSRIFYGLQEYVILNTAKRQPQCFRRVYQNQEVSIFKVLCKVREL